MDDLLLKVLTIGLAVGSFFLLGKIKTHKNEPLPIVGPTLVIDAPANLELVGSTCRFRPAPGDTVYAWGRERQIIAQTVIPTDAGEESYLWKIFANFKSELTIAPRCSL